MKGIEPIRILELRSVWGTGGGPEKTILFGAARADRDRFAVTACYLRDARDAVFRLDGVARDLGVDYVEIPERHSFDPKIWSALRRLVRAGRFDIVHAHDYKTDLLALLVSKAEGVTPLATAHGWSGTTVRERLLYYPVDRRLLARYPKVIAVSPAIREILIAVGAPPERIAVVLNGVDTSAFRRDPARRVAARAAIGIEPRHQVVGAIGRLEPIKRVDLLLEAFARARRVRPDLHLVVAGGGSLASSLERSARRLAADACTFLGHHADVISLHHALDCFVQSSDSEGTSNALLEAMAMETPIVATAVGGTGSLIRDGVDGRLVPPGDVVRLCDAIERTLDDGTATWQRVRSARQRVVEDFSFAARTRKVDAIYEELVLPRRRGSAGSPVGGS